MLQSSCPRMVSEALHVGLGFAGEQRRWYMSNIRLTGWLQAHNIKERTKEKLDTRQDATKSKFRKAFGLRVRCCFILHWLHHPQHHRLCISAARLMAAWQALLRFRVHSRHRLSAVNLVA